MNIKKINEYTLKMLFKDNPRVLYERVDDNEIMVSPDGFVAFILSDKDFKFDPAKLGGEPTHIISALAKQIENSASAEIVGYRDAPEGKGELAHIKSDETFAFIDRKYLKYFNKDAMFSIVSPKSQVYVYEYGKFVGFIMPVRVDVEE